MKMLLAAPATCTPSFEATAMPPVSRRSSGPSRDAARVRSNWAKALCSSVRASSSGSVIAASGQSRRGGIPREAGEQGAAQPFADGPGATEHEHKNCPVGAAEAPGEATCQSWIDGEVERHEHDRDPAEPGGHCRLIGERGRDPVEANHELAETERPAGEQCPPQRLRAGEKLAKGGQGEQKQWPQAGRLERKGRSGAGE